MLLKTPITGPSLVNAMGETTFSPSFAFHCPTNPQMTPLINPNRRIGMRFIRNLFCYSFVTHFRIFIFRLPVLGISGFPIPKSQRQLLPVWRQKGMNEIFFDPNQQRARPHFSRTGARMLRPSIRRICKVASGLGHAQCIAHPDVIGLSCGFVDGGVAGFG